MNKILKNFKKREDEDLRCLFNLSADLLCVAGTDGFFKRLNPTFERLLGYTSVEILSKPFYDFIHPDDKQSTFNEIQKLGRGQLLISFGNRYRCKDGAYIWLSWNAKAVGDKIYAIGRDITLVKKTEDALAEQQKKILLNSAKLCSLGEMALGIGHEIKNPVTIINLMSIQLKRLAKGGQPDMDAISKFANKIEHASLRIDKIVNGLKTLARNGEGDSLQDANLQTIIEEMVEVACEHLKKNQVEIKVIKLNHDPIVECRSSQIAQVLLNLICNSCDAVKDLDERWIEINYTSDDQFYYVSVTDSGHGIPSELHSKIFDSFYTSKAIGKGTGLGLSISKKIIESHGGFLIIDSKYPHTKFVFSLIKKDKVAMAA